MGVSNTFRDLPEGLPLWLPREGRGKAILLEARRVGPAFDLFLPFVIGRSLPICQGGLFLGVVACLFPGAGPGGGAGRARLCFFEQKEGKRTGGAIDSRGETGRISASLEKRFAEPRKEPF